MADEIFARTSRLAKNRETSIAINEDMANKKMLGQTSLNQFAVIAYIMRDISF